MGPSSDPQVTAGIDVTAGAADRRWRRAAVSAAIAFALAGCGSGTTLLTKTSSHARTPSSSAFRGVSAGQLRVIMGWSNALRSGHVATAAGFFALPSEFYDGGDDPAQLRSRADAIAANAALPCGARLIAAKRRGPYVNALFRLADRPGAGGGGGCGSGTGQTARTNILIRGGKIVKWLRAPDQPGDNPAPPQKPSGGATGGQPI